MISRAVVLALVVAVASGRIIQKPKSHHQMVLMPALSGCPPAFEPAPIICRFMQPDQFHYKPQLIAPSTYIPPLVVEKCDHPQLEIELPAPEKPIVIPEAPVLPPITIPKFPVPVIVEEPLAVPIEPCEPAFVADLPAMDIPVAPALPTITLPTLPFVAKPEPCLNEEVVPEFHQPMIVPQPPELPQFVMPEIPAIDVPAVEPCLEDQVIPVAPIAEYIHRMPLPIIETVVPEMPVMNIPATPELPPLEMPVLPEIVVLPEPKLPALPEMPVRVEVPMAEPCIEDHPIAEPMPDYIPLPVPEYMPAPVPTPIVEPCEPAFIAEMPKIPMVPELPSFAMPALPEIVAQPEPVYTEIVPPEVNYHPLGFPMAPELPAFKLPEPMRVEPAKVVPCPEDQVSFVIPEYIPSPELPKMPFPAFPVNVVNKPEDPCITGEISLIVPQFPKLPEPIAIPVMPSGQPCEPSAELAMNIAEFPPYFVKHASHIPRLPMDYSFFPAPYMRHL